MTKLFADDKRLKFPHFNEEQEKFVFNRYPFVVGSGGYGSGKTTALVCRAILLSVDSEWFGDCSGAIGLLGRHKMLDFTKTTLTELWHWLPPAWVKPGGWNKKDGTLELINGSVIHFTHLDNREHLQSYNLTWVGIDQMEQVPENVFDCLSMDRIRCKVYTRYYPKSQGGGLVMPKFDKRTGKCISTNPEELDAVVKYRTVFGVCNPRPCWIEDTFYTNEQHKDSPDEYVQAKYNSEFKYIHIPTRENTSNLPWNYIERQFKNKSAREYARDVEGSWEAWEGKVFLGCTRSVLASHNIVPHPAWDIYVGIDHGGTGDDRTKRTGVKAAVFIAYQYRKGQYPKVYIFDELYCQAITIEEFIAQIDNKLKRIYISQSEFYPDAMQFTLDNRVDNRAKITKWRCDPTMNKKIEEKQYTIIERYTYFAKLRGMDMLLMSGDADEVSGTEIVDWMFRKKIMEICPKCINTYSEHSSLEYDDNGKIKKLQRDHLVTALKYIVSAFPREFNSNMVIEKPETLVDRELAKMEGMRKQAVGGRYGSVC